MESIRAKFGYAGKSNDVLILMTILNMYNILGEKVEGLISMKCTFCYLLHFPNNSCYRTCKLHRCDFLESRIE